jgi:peptide chain release factor 3
MEADVDMPSFLAGESTPVFAGSALTNFGVRHLLDAIVDLAPAPSPRLDVDDKPRHLDEPCSAFVFKVQANMDRNHRDRIAFARICSGRFDRGMVMTCERTGKPFATKYASTVFGAERTTVDEAFPGDVVGLVNATGLNLGDTLYDESGPSVKFPPIPAFAPEVFATARPVDTGKMKQFRKGLDQLNEEGVVQVLKDPDWGDASPVLAAVGQLQFDVFANRLDIEFNAPIEILSAPYQAIRLTDKASADVLREKPGVRILARLDGRLVALFENKYALARIEQNEPELTLDHIIAG